MDDGRKARPAPGVQGPPSSARGLADTVATMAALAALATPEGQALAATLAQTIGGARALSAGLNATAKTGRLGVGLAAGLAQFVRDSAQAENRENVIRPTGKSGRRK